MSHSTTTATSTYVLTRYSKSTQKDENNGDGPMEWQHFTNPTIQLVLDQRKGTQLESVRLRILWSMELNNPNGNVVVFEDVDLLTFSRLPHNTMNRHSESQPLKAVYRENLVGIRYLHLADSNKEPVYRRFQITFQTSAAASEFINIIRPVCPCKCNPTPAPTKNVQSSDSQRNAPSVIPARSAREENASGNGPPQTPNKRPEFPFPALQQLEHRQRDQTQLLSNAWHGPYASMHESSSPACSSSTMATPTPSSSMPPPPVPITMSNDFPRSNSFCYSSESALQQPSMNRFASQPHVACETSAHASFSQQSLVTGNTGHQARSAHQLTVSLPTSLDSMAPVLAASNPTADSTQDPAAAILASLRTATALYELSQPALERIVAQVIREEGFVRLMEKLDSMWGLKGCMGM